MKTAPDLKSTADYVQALRPLLPAHVFAPNPKALLRVALHILVLLAGYTWLTTTARWSFPVASLIIGHSLACLAFIAHDVSHGSVIRHKAMRGGLEILLWGLNLIPPTLWRRVHNQTHHVETNTRLDPDRAFLESEKTSLTLVYTRVFYPNRRTPLRHPLFLVHFVAYILRNVVASMQPNDWKLPVVPHKPAFHAGHRVAIVVELILIGLMQYALWLCLGRSIEAYVWASPVPILVASGVVMLYVFTNHFLNPLCENTDPLVGSTSVVVPQWVNWLHDNFSYHTEHHVFPSVNPRYYPLVSELLSRQFPDRYNRLPLREAWCQLWKQEGFLKG